MYEGLYSYLVTLLPGIYPPARPTGVLFVKADDNLKVLVWDWLNTSWDVHTSEDQRL